MVRSKKVNKSVISLPSDLRKNGVIDSSISSFDFYEQANIQGMVGKIENIFRTSSKKEKGGVVTNLDFFQIPKFSDDPVENKQKIASWLNEAFDVYVHPEKDKNSDLFLRKDLNDYLLEIRDEKISNDRCLSLLEKKEVQRLNAVLQKAKDYLAEELYIDIPNNLNICFKTKREILDFLNIVSLKISQKNRPYVCALLKVSRAILYIENNPRLQNLVEKSQAFEHQIWESFNTGKNLDEVNSDKYKSLAAQTEYGGFGIIGFDVRDKSLNRMISKLLRKPEADFGSIINDGVGGRLVVNARSTEKAIALFTKKHGFRFKNSENASRGAAKGKDIYLVKNLEDGTPVEIQISTPRNIQKGESGIYDHRVYSATQNLLAACRLFGGISPARVKAIMNSLASIIGVKKSGLDKKLKELFFFHPENKRWYSYEYVYRTKNKGIVPVSWYKSMLNGLSREFNQKIDDVLYGESDLQFILENGKFPASFSMNHKKSMLSFLKKKKGVSSVLMKLLEAQIFLDRFNKYSNSSFCSQNDMKKIISDKKIPEKFNVSQKHMLEDFLRVEELV